MISLFLLFLASNRVSSSCSTTANRSVLSMLTIWAERFVVDLYVTDQNHDQTWNRVRHNEPAPFTAFFYQDKLYALRFHKTPNGELVELDRMTGRARPSDRSGMACANSTEHYRPRSLLCQLSRKRGRRSSISGPIDGKPLGTLPLEDGYTWRPHSEDTQMNPTNSFFIARSFTAPPIVLHCDGDFERRTVWNRRQAPTSSSSFVARKHRYLSKDGTEVEVSIVGPSRIRPDSKSPGNNDWIYGGFGASSTPLFSPFVSVMLELGCLFVLPENTRWGRTWNVLARSGERPKSSAVV